MMKAKVPFLGETNGMKSVKLARRKMNLARPCLSHYRIPLRAILFLCCLTTELLPCAWGFTIHVGRPSARVVGRRRISLASDPSPPTDEEADLFDYFDPLLSPHKYPKGISPDQKPVDPTDVFERSEPPPLQKDDDDESYNPLQWGRGGTSGSTTMSLPEESADLSRDEERPAVDPSTTFDPTLSPHTYNQGVPSIIVGDEDASYLTEDEAQAVPTMRQTRSINKPLGFTTPLANKSLTSLKTDLDRLPVNPATTFDPTLSPHEYENGVPDVIVGDPGTDYLEEITQRTVGILLIDHGSRNEASNRRFQEMARLYQEKVGTSSANTLFVVRAAHMEIATPSIPDGIETLMEAGVDEIVCHPYFLSPSGRHAQEDIPRIISEAVESLQIDIPVVATDPVGSNTDVMINVIHSLVEETSTYYRGETSKRQ